jgi:hypothetical protein
MPALTWADAGAAAKNAQATVAQTAPALLPTGNRCKADKAILLAR